MATNTINTRITLKGDTSENWTSSTLVLLKNEFAYENDTMKIKVGDGTKTFNELSYINLTPTEVDTLIQAVKDEIPVFTNKDILDATSASFTEALKAKLDGIADGATKTIVDSALSSTSTNPVQNKVINSALDNKVPITRTINNKVLSANISLTADDVGAIDSSLKGAASGVAELDSDGKVPSSQLPSYVDDVVEGYLSSGTFYSDSGHTTVLTAETSKIYVDLSTNKTYRYSGSTYVEVSASLALGETSSTAYRGDRGKIAYDHSQSTHAPTDAEKNVIIGVQVNGTDLTVDSTTRKVNVPIPTKVSELTNDSGYITSSGTAAAAGKLTTAYSIDGVNFNGTTDIIHYGICSTEAGTVAKTVSVSNFELITGSRVIVKFTVTNTASSPTLNVNGTGAKSIYYRGAAITAGYLAANRTYEFVYNGSQYELVGDIDTNTDTKVTNTLATTTKAYVTGTTTSVTHTGTQIFDTGVYLDTTAGTLVATNFVGSLTGKATSAGTADNANMLNSYSLSTAGTKDVWGTIPSIGGTDGVMEVGKYIDFHTTDGSTTDYDVRITASTDGINITGTTTGTFNGTLYGNATTATTAAMADQLTNSRTISISGGVTGVATSFNGSTDISIPVIKVNTDYLVNGDNTLILVCGDSGDGSDTTTSLNDVEEIAELVGSSAITAETSTEVSDSEIIEVANLIGGDA